MKILKPDSETDQQDFFYNLPLPITVDILSRIPVKTVLTCKCVCKSWLDLLETPYFTRSHLSKSVPGLLIHRITERDLFRIVEFEDSLEIDSHDLHYKTVLELDFDDNFSPNSYTTFIEGSANGLLFMRTAAPTLCNYYVCNPITREYIKLPQPEGILQNGTIATNGFGASRSSDQYKVVRIFHERVLDPNSGSLLSITKTVWQVYTLGTPSWRVITTPCEMLLDYGCCRSSGSLLNGNLHWLARDLKGSWWISRFDLETEVFTKFRAPAIESGGSVLDIGVLRDRLCLCDNSSEAEMSIYMLDDCGDEEKSWKKEYAMSKIPHFSFPTEEAFIAVKAFSDGDVLMKSQYCYLSCYSNRTKTTEVIHMFNGYTAFNSTVEAIQYIPSFISLKDFEMENAKVCEFVCLMRKV